MKTFSLKLLPVLLAVSLLLGLCIALLPRTVAAEKITMVFAINQSTYTINGVFTPMDVPPVIIEGRTMLPIRFVADPLGAAVGWDPDTSKVTVQLKDTKLELWIGQSNAVINGKTLPIDAANANVRPLIINGRTMLPLRFVSENLGCDLDWDAVTQQVTLVQRSDEADASLSLGSDLPEATAPLEIPEEWLTGDEGTIIIELDDDEPESPVVEDEKEDTPSLSSNLPLILADEELINKPSLLIIFADATPDDIVIAGSILAQHGLPEQPSVLIPLDPSAPVATATRPATVSDLVVISNQAQLNPKLTWVDNADNEDGYQVVRHLHGGSGTSATKEFLLPANSTSYIDTEAAGGSTYSYAVRAYNKTGNAYFKEVVCTAFQLGSGGLTDPDVKGLNFLGRGYNVLGDFASPDTTTSLKVPILDVAKMMEWRQIDHITSFNLSEYYEVIERSAYDYCKTTTKSVKTGGGFMGFSGSVESKFGSNIKERGSRYLGSITYWVRLHEYQLADPLNFNWRNFVYPAVLEAINNPAITPAQILDSYGSHILTSVRIGGRMDYNVSIESAYTESFSTFEKSVGASFNAGFASAGLKVGNGSQEFSSNFNSRAERKVRCIGGVLHDAGLMDPQTAASKLNEWRQSLEGPTGTPTLCDFGGQELKPIWELCSSAARAKQIKDEFIKRVNGQTGYPRPGYVSDLYFPSKNQGASGYISTSVNLNEYGNGRYLFYLLDDRPEVAITDIFAVFDPDITSSWYKNTGTTAAGPFWHITHNGNAGDYYFRAWNLNNSAKFRWFQQHSSFLSTTYSRHSRPSKDIALLVTKTPNTLPIKTIEVLYGLSFLQVQARMTAEPDWNWVCLLNQKIPFNFSTDVSSNLPDSDNSLAFVAAESIYIRFLRG
ncbi:MAG: stalk domain-containing protein [Symbiobacteriaceae bacterium]|nr:stalk domain-containing protein [Symbiobacteriaceae bacterium]